MAVYRYGALGLLGAGAVGIFAKRHRLIRQGKCIGGGICDGCEILSRCDLPRALSAREALIGGDNARE
ncbi:MAG: hypothetical protein JSW47_00650 [Phycisphaerales bacterium]|nr:MAG: hypothetical protein JSW47_00650 [Phycisphaerales bacterium]